MLAATRDPMPDRGTQAPPVSHGDYRPLPPLRAPRATRVITALQMAGSVLAIPVALGSAYSVYQANFSPDLACQNLRAGIVAMIDKKIDAATRRMLVRRDVEAFEKSCGSFDPDAKAAFANLLAEPRTVVHVPVTPKADPAKADAAKADAEKAEAKKAESAKAEPRPAPVAKLAPAETEVASDARWLDAVRGALTTHAEPRAPAPASAAQPLGKLIVAPPAQTAPALPAATAVPLPAPSEHANDPDRPVPPAAIPEADQRTARATWVSRIPFVGQVLDK
jgi:hypothetical protein